MSILDDNVIIDHDLEVQQQKQLIVAWIKGLYAEMQNRHQTIWDLLWNSDKATTQEILNAFGADAAQLFITSAKIQELLSMGGNYNVLIPPKEYIISEDGTVIIKEN